MVKRSTSSDLDLVNYIIEHTDKHGFPPSRRQIADRLGVASATVAQRRLERLVREGVIERTPGVPRGIRVNVDRARQMKG